MKKEKLKILVNFITIFRLVGAFILIPIYYNYNLKVVSLFSLFLFSTDLIDGFLARKFKVSTFFGSIMDSISDKALGIISFAILSSISSLMYVPLVIEAVIPIVTLISIKNGANVSSSRLGKIKTWILGISVIGSFLSALYEKHSLEMISYLAALATTFCILAVIDYIAHSYNAVKNKNTLVIIDYNSLERKTFKELFKDIWSCEFYKKYKDAPIKKLLYKKNAKFD